MPIDQDDAASSIEDCLKVADFGSHPFTEWEIVFLESIEKQVAEGRLLSSNQLDVLDKLISKI